MVVQRPSRASPKRSAARPNDQELLSHHRRFLKDKGIPLSLAIEAGIRSVRIGQGRALERAGFTKSQVKRIELPALLIPLTDLRGDIANWQVRPDDPLPGQAKYKTIVHRKLPLYIPPGVRPRLIAGQPWDITESPLKALALRARGRAAMGVCGVWGWSEEGDPIADFELLRWSDADVHLWPDSDVATNPRVFEAVRQLRNLLVKLHARPVAQQLPFVDGIADKEHKNGVDDFLGRDGTEEDLLAVPEFTFPATHPANPDYIKALDRERIAASVREDVRLERAAAGFGIPNSTESLTVELSLPDPPMEYVVEGFQMEGHNVSLAGSFKSGKTSLTNHLTKCLCDDEPFLGLHDVRLRDRVGVWNYEMTEKQWRSWLREVGVKNTDRAAVLHLRSTRLPITTPVGEDFAVRWLREHNIGYLIIDTYARAMADCGLDENVNADVEAFTRALDLIKASAGVRDLLLTAHTGRTQQEAGREHARGGTRIDDWVDARWILTQEGDHRFIRATGRDIEQPERELFFKSTTRTMTAGEGDRRSVKIDEDVARLVGEVAAHPGVNKTDLRGYLRWNRDRAENAAGEAEKRGEIRTERGPKNATLYYQIELKRRISTRTKPRAK